VVRDVAEAVLEVLTSRRRGALATVVRTSGSTPQRPGARLLLRPDGTTVGTVGGGAFELLVKSALQEARRTGEPCVIHRHLGHDLGMCCGGQMEVFVEPIEAAPRLIIFGAGHIAQPTASLARTVGFDVTVVDDREEWNTEERFPGCERALADPAGFVQTTELAEHDAVLIVTHDHALDEKVLDLCVQRQLSYIGLVGSRRKAVRLMDRVAERRGPLPLDRIHAPVGLDLGAVTPAEIGLAIVAELVALRRGGTSAPLGIANDGRLAERLSGGADVAE
jgi:xanthine dehydrogenase accessory factor